MWFQCSMDIHSNISFENVAISFYLEYYCSAGVNCYLDLIELFYSSFIPSKMVLQRFWNFMVSIHDELDDMDQ